MILSKRQKQKLIRYILFILLLVTLVFGYLFYKEIYSSDLTKVYFLDIGEGNASLIKTGEGQNILIDGGPDNSVLSELGEVLPFYDKHISLIISTHPHLDHLYGLISVLENYQVDEFLFTDVDYDTQYYKKLKNILLQKNIKTTILQGSLKYNLDEDTFLKVIYPLKSLQGKQVKNLNNSSIVVQLVDGVVKYLFTGDIEKEAERKIIASRVDIDSDIVLSPHHGSSTSSTKSFIQAVSPDIAVISAGKDNKFGHPHKEVLGLYNLLNINILRTDIENTIEIDSDGDNYFVK